VTDTTEPATHAAAAANGTLDAAIATAAQWRDMTDRVKRVLVDRLELPIPHQWITDDQPLFGRGLELDGLDALELRAAVDQEFGTSVDEEDTSLFGSVSAFVGYLIGRQEELPPQEAQRLALPKTGGAAPLTAPVIPDD
jgi:acyl carrier protein